MIIDQNAAVVPPQFLDEELNRLQDRYLDEADEEDMKAAFLWVTEGRLALSVYGTMHRLCEAVQRETDHAEQRMRWSRASSPTDGACRRVAMETARRIRAELNQADRDREKVADTWREMRDDFGHASRIRERYLSGGEREASPLDDHIKLARSCDEVVERVNQILQDDIDALYELALQEDEFLAFTRSDDSVSLSLDPPRSGRAVDGEIRRGAR
ncbi:hypothetical protein [Streptomyces sp. H27-H5]|uniref:hypothetical protein n=1 Tax=Streptomyces sp. H27-H5 TaxID=2996460 RepID=UPI002271BC36|nr:hypothetical protein [Streptomyces sp. H27-H5]MCY0963188.1 hypothetical protein [Streptomyces sp. H27-H5]